MTRLRGFPSRCLPSLAAAILLLAASRPTLAQSIPAPTSQAQIQEQLLHQPLYLRGFWMGYTLDFDSTGQPTGKADDRPQPGPLTLSGLDVQDVSIKGKKLILHASRVALVANAQGILERRPLLNTTLMFGTMQKQYRSKEMVKLTIQADANGSFDAPLHAVFANGLDELAPSAPPAWRCYANTYFATQQPTTAPEEAVRACITLLKNTSLPFPDNPPALLTQPQPHGTLAAAELHVSGESEVYVSVDEKGIPSGFQVVRALGAGADEDTLQALSQCRFSPATRAGVPVSSGIYFTMQYR